jgi:4-hydroxy-2-oxoglutarate aldolase
MTENLTGVFSPITTPFDQEGKVLVDKCGENIDKWNNSPIAGLLVLGSSGESHFLADDERLALVTRARARISKDKTLIVGAGRESTYLCVDFVRRIADIGADYALVGTPCYYKPKMDDNALFAHFWSLADASPIPILIYNIPQYTGVNTCPALMEKLSAHENIVGMKDSSGSLVLQAEILRRTPENFQILTGSAPTFLPSLIQGAVGGIVAVACVLPDLTVQIFEAFRAGDWKRAAGVQEQISAPATAVTSTFGISGLKAAMDMMGYFGGEPRLPLLPLDDKQRVALSSIFQAAGITKSAHS